MDIEIEYVVKKSRVFGVMEVLVQVKHEKPQQSGEVRTVNEVELRLRLYIHFAQSQIFRHSSDPSRGQIKE